jgi:hypothetical protein
MWYDAYGLAEQTFNETIVQQICQATVTRVNEISCHLDLSLPGNENALNRTSRLIETVLSNFKKYPQFFPEPVVGQTYIHIVAAEACRSR